MNTTSPTHDQLAKLADQLKASNDVDKRVIADSIRWHLANDTEAQKTALWQRMWERFGFSTSFRL